jgi:hypothetical protein
MPNPLKVLGRDGTQEDCSVHGKVPKMPINVVNFICSLVHCGKKTAGLPTAVNLRFLVEIPWVAIVPFRESPQLSSDWQELSSNECCILFLSRLMDVFLE